MTEDTENAAIAAWARLLRAHRIALSTVEGLLKAAGLPPLAWYDVLLELDRVGDRGLRPFQLEHEMLLEQYNLSRLLAKIEQRGLIERHPCEDDGRGHVLKITSAGKALRRKMWPVYSDAIQEAVGERLSSAEASRLGELLGRLTT